MMNNIKPVAQAHNLGKTYWLYPSPRKRLLGSFIAPNRIKGVHPHQALANLSFEIYPGQALALIGKNGAGKSTALQILAGILTPSEGEFIINGRVGALLELGSGFNPEYTGRENIKIVGALAGLSREEIAASEQSIIDFADIGEYIDQPVKFYSSGMFVRLAFSIAISSRPDLLIVDEALAVGDVFFRQKCYARLYEMRKKGMAVILVTHSAGDVTEFCDQAILLEHGNPSFIGEPKEAILQYYLTMQEKKDAVSREQAEPSNNTKAYHDETIDSWQRLAPHFTQVAPEAHDIASHGNLLRFCLVDDNDKPRLTFEQGGTMRFYAECSIYAPTKIPITGITIWNAKGVPVYSGGTPFYEDIAQPSAIQGSAKIFIYHETKLNLAPGEYTLSFGFGEMEEHVYNNRHLVLPEEWTAASRRLINVSQLAAFDVVFPVVRYPSRVMGYGLVGLPGTGAIIVRPMDSNLNSTAK